ncbi:MAG TPA: amino acid adenylation domain-containing protein [Candidatus Binataceae bacterium]|nr:amino acid adenylation domain-containing protein [Candidatus Binataceae bacterium]
MRPAVLPALLEEAAERYAERPALVMENRRLTYGELDALSSRIGHSLLRGGIRSGDRVALWFDRSLEGLAALWGVAKAGAAYVPIDPTAPPARMATISRNCEISALFTTSDRIAQIQAAFEERTPMRATWLLDSNVPETASSVPLVSWSEIANESATAPRIEIKPEALASVYYTSGSTGEPKGVMTSHRSLADQARWTPGVFGIDADDRIAGYTPLQSVMSTLDIFASVAAGAATYLVPRRIGSFPAALARSFAEQRLTIWYLVPSALVMMVRRGNFAALDFSALRLVAFGGETLPLARMRELMELLPQVRFIQVYGRTEAKVRSYHEIKRPPEERDLRTIGLVPADCGLHPLDEELKPVAHNEVGELWITGPGLMSGYWGLPELTAELMPTIEIKGEMVRASRTGDLVRRLSDGTFELVGRADQQVKIRGYRVEIAEVERALNQHPGVARAIVVVDEDALTGHRLRAVVERNECASIDERVLSEHCFMTLPRYMVPERFEFRAALPISSNGKVDRRALGAGLDRSAEEKK